VSDFCECGCGLAVERNRAGTRRFASAACRARAYRNRVALNGDAAVPAIDASLAELRQRKDAIGDRLGDEGLSAGECARLSAEFRMLVTTILRLEGRKPVEQAPKAPSKIDELIAHRAARRAHLQQAQEGE
jgi:hypothetical protein